MTAYFKVLFQYSLSATTKVSVEISGLRMFQTGNLHNASHNHYLCVYKGGEVFSDVVGCNRNDVTVSLGVTTAALLMNRLSPIAFQCLKA
jgi:hypothetical protein